jgi:hypothetical protein
MTESVRTSWTLGNILLMYTALQPRRQPSSYSPPWEPQIQQSKGVQCHMNREHARPVIISFKGTSGEDNDSEGQSQCNECCEF